MPFAGGIPCEADARLGKEFRAIVSESGGTDGGLRVDDSIGELVVRGTAMCLVPAVAAFHAQAGAQLKMRCHLPNIFDIASSEP